MNKEEKIIDKVLQILQKEKNDSLKMLVEAFEEISKTPNVSRIEELVKKVHRMNEREFCYKWAARRIKEEFGLEK